VVSRTDLLEDKARGENFPVALRVLPARVRGDLLAAYRYARYVDDLGDEAPGRREPALLRVADDVRRLYDGGVPSIPVVRDLEPLVRDRGVPAHVWARLVQANLQDQQVTRYETFEDLLGYCALSANPVGEVVLHVFGQADPERVALSDRVCTGLQLVEHWQDIGEDYRNGRVYLPQEDLRAFGVHESMLGADRACPQLVDLVGYQTDRAVAWLGSGAVLVSTLRGWARLAVSGYVSGGLAAAGLLRRGGYDPLAGVPKPTIGQVTAVWLAGKVRRPG
jgi:squalene synthase HpnC